MNRTLKFLLLSLLGLLATVISLSLKVSIMGAQKITGKQMLVEKIHDFALSPDGEHIAFCNIEGLKILSLKSGKQKWLFRFPSKLKECPVRHIKWSPDMTRISFVKGFSPHQSELTVLELATKSVHVIDRSLGFCGIAWSPDGKKLAWVKEEGRAGGQRYRFIIAERVLLMVGALEDVLKDKVHSKVLYEVKGGDEQPPLRIYSLGWTPDGQFLVFVREAGWNPTVGHLPSALGVMRSDGTNLKWLHPSERFPMHGYYTIPYSGWAISPDSTTLAFGIGEFLWLYSLRNPEAPPVKIRLVGRALEICWSPDGKGLLYVVSESKAPVAPGSAQTGPPHSLYWVDKGGKENRLILREEKGIRNLRWLKGQDIFYISGGALWKVTLRL